MEKWPILDHHQGQTPFEKSQFFDFYTSCFYTFERCFIRSPISFNPFSWPLLPQSKKMEKWPILDHHQGQTPFEKSQFFDFYTSCFYTFERCFIRSPISFNPFSWPLLPQSKKMEKWPILDHHQGQTPFEKSQFFDSYTSCFYTLERRFIRSPSS